MTGSDMIAPVGRQVYPADPWVVIQQSNKLAELERDIARDPEGHFWRTGAHDRRVPPWHATVSECPDHIMRRLERMLRGAGQDSTQFSLVFAWFTDTFDFVRWMPTLEEAAPRVGQLIYVPVELSSVPASLGWDSVGDEIMNQWRIGFHLAHDRTVAARERSGARTERDRAATVARLADRVRRAEATDAELEEYEAAVVARDGAAGDEWRELAKDARPIFRDLANDLGM